MLTSLTFVSVVSSYTMLILIFEMNKPISWSQPQDDIVSTMAPLKCGAHSNTMKTSPIVPELYF